MPQFFEVTDLSPLLKEGSGCVYCHSDLALKERVVICDACGSPHHHDCWKANGGRCATFGCAASGTSGANMTRQTATNTGRASQIFLDDHGGRARWNLRRTFGAIALICLIFYVLLNEADPSQRSVIAIPAPTATQVVRSTSQSQPESPLEVPAEAIAPFSDCSGAVGINEGDCEVLITFYDNTDGPNWIQQAGWRSTNHPCEEWHGITCKNERVTQIQLSSNRLSGEIPPEIGSLSALSVLAMSRNQLQGPIPSTIGQLPELILIFLADNQLEGALPPEIGNLSKLSRVHLTNNQLSGEIPAGLGQLSALKWLDLSRNRLNRPITVEVACSAAFRSGLEILNIQYNQLVAADDQAKSCLDEHATNWATTQTIAPMDLEATVILETTVRLSWTPILYIEDGGYYEVGRSDDGGATFTVVKQTRSKTDSTLVFVEPVDRDSGIDYLYAVRTFTPARYGQQNALTSEYSEAVRARPASE